MLAQHNLEIENFVDSSLSKLREDGYVVLNSFFDSSFVESLYGAYKERIDAPMSYAGKIGRSYDDLSVTYVDLPLTLHLNSVKFATCEPIRQIVERYLGTPIILSYVVAYRTYPIRNMSQRWVLRTPGVFSGWHSDANVTAKNRGYRCVVSMLYLNDVGLGGGGLELIRGSHTYGSQKRVWTSEEVEERRKDIVEICAPAGSVILFDMEIVHRAGIPTDIRRDILRCNYAPQGGYGEPLVFSNDTLPAEVDPEVARLLRLGRTSSVGLPLSEGILRTNLSRLRSFLGRIKKQIKFNLHRRPVSPI